MSAERRRVEVPDDLSCSECGADCDLVKLMDKEDAQPGDAISEIRCANGHLQLRFLAPGPDAIAAGVALMEREKRRRT